MQTVENWQDIIKNLIEFKNIVSQSKTLAHKRFSNFYHWYYFPEEDLFAPGKFLGYKGTKISNYIGEGDGGETQIALSKYFDKLPEGSEHFIRLFHKLQEFATSLDKIVNRKTSSGKGGIYIPKKQSLRININYSEQLLATSTADIKCTSE